MGPRFRPLAIALSCAACGLSVVGSGPGAQGEDGGPPLADASTAPSDVAAPTSEASASSDADSSVVASPVAIASAGKVEAPTGNAQQAHLVHAEKGKRWWLFTIAEAAPLLLQAWSSADFATWKQAGDLTLPRAHRNIGANFSVAYATVAGRDIVHLGIGLAGTGNVKTHYHARAELQADTIAWGSLSAISSVDDSALGDPEGSTTAITESGRVVDFTGWSLTTGAGTGNQNAFVSQSLDNGTAWTGGFGGHVDLGTVDKSVNARAALSLGGETLLAFWESAETEPDPRTVRWSRTTNGGSNWNPTLQVVFENATFGVNDWGVTALAANDVHAIRCTSTFEHRRFDGASWRNGDPIAALPGNPRKNAGLVVLHDEARVALATIAADDAIHLTTWSAGAWSAWSRLVPTGNKRSALSGWSSPSAGIALVWTEIDGTGARVVGLRPGR